MDPVLLKFHLHALDAENATFHDLRNLKADLQRRLDRGMTPSERAQFQTSRTEQPFGTDLGQKCCWSRR